MARNKNPTLTVSRPKNFNIGGDVMYKRDLSRFVRWPKYIRLQRKRKVLYDRLPLPPSLNQFTYTLDKNQATTLFSFLSKYRPESEQAKATRVKEIAAAKAAGKTVPQSVSKPPLAVKYGINHVYQLVEQRKAKLVVIAHDVDPVELVVALPALCRKMDIPYVIVKGKARLGALCRKKTCTAIAVTQVEEADKHKFARLVQSARKAYNNNWENIATKWGNSS